MKEQTKATSESESIHEVDELLKQASTLSKVFPPVVTRALLKADLKDLDAVLALSEKSFVEILGKANLKKSQINLELKRFKRFKKKIETGEKPEDLTGLAIDLPDSVKLSAATTIKLDNAGVYGLSDWIEQRDQVKIAAGDAKKLDQYGRLSVLKIDGDQAKTLIANGIDSAIALSRLSISDTAKFAEKVQMKQDDVFNLVARAQKHSTDSLKFLDLIDKYRPDDKRSDWLDDIVIINPGLLCNPCAEDESAFSCFAYYVYLVQKTGLTLEQLKKQLDLDIDLKQLSPLAEDEMLDDPQAPCEQISLLKLIIRNIQDYLEQLRNRADSSEDRERYDFLDYPAWRAERMADIYPELKALWQNDVLISLDIDEEQGSILMDRAEKRQQITDQIDLAKQALASAKVDRGSSTVSDQQFDSLPNFTDEPFYADYLHGFSILERILEADDVIHEATIDNQNYQSGLALAKLEQALELIDVISAEVFPDDSFWHHPDYARPFNYSDLIQASPMRRKQVLLNSFDELMTGRKTIFEPVVKDITLDGLTDEGEIDIDHAAWSASNNFDQNSSGEIVVQENYQNPNSRTIHYLRGDNNDDFSDYGIAMDFELEPGGYVQQFGFRIRTTPAPNRSYYRVFIRTQNVSDEEIAAAEKEGDNVLLQILLAAVEFVAGEDDGLGGTYDYLVLEKVDGLTGNRTQLDKAKIGYSGNVDLADDVILSGETYRLSLQASGNFLRATLRKPTGDSITVEDEDATIDKGSFSILAPPAFAGKLNNFEFIYESGQGLPPFHASGRVGFPDGRPSMSLNNDVYYRHRVFGHGMSTKLMPMPFVRPAQDNDKVRLHGVRRADRDLFMVFKSGTNKVKPNDINNAFEKALAMLFFMRYAVIPIRMSQAYYQAGEFERAFELLRLLYDDTADEQDENKKQIYPAFAQPPDSFNRAISPDVRLMRLRLAEAYLAQAETLFRSDSQPNRYQARKLFQRVLSLHQANCNCENRIGEITEDIIDRLISVIPDPGKKPDHLYDPDFWAMIGTIYDKGADIEDLTQIIDKYLPTDGVTDPPEHETAIKNITTQIEQSLGKYNETVAKHLVYPDVMQRGQQLLLQAELHTAKHQSRLDYLNNISSDYRNKIDYGTGKGWIYGVFNYPAFCVPQNPLKSQQVKQACLMLKLLNNCLNILGFRDDFVPQLRFEALLAIANDFAQKSQAAERDLLNFRQLFEQHSFSLMQAQQNLVLTDADVSLEGLNVEVAGGDRNIALLQSGQASAARQHYEDLIAAGLSESEKFALMTAFASTTFSGLALGGSVASSIVGVVASVAGGGGGGSLPGVPFGELASFSSSLSNLYRMQAEYERREQNWEFNLQQNRFSEVIAQENVQQAERRFAIAKTRQQIAELRRDFAMDAVQFLNHKFLNGAMYAWMIKTIREQYRTRLNYAIAASYMAERALAFEIQNSRLDVIRFDYFNPTRDGLLGATQLQTDLTTLEQTHLQLSQRKLQLSKTLSLAQLFPVEFQHFKQTGILPFSTALGNWNDPDRRSDADRSLELFDRDFPGHYMRLIKSVRVSVIALVPPIDGIKATLRNSGISHAVTGPPYADRFEEITIRRQPDAIALSAPFNATGVFVLDYKDKFLLPFEGNGAATDWVLELPKPANNFDFETLFDVLVTIDYTSLESDETPDASGKTFRQQVIESLGDEVSADRSYSVKFNFPDAWYYLNNPQSPLPQLEPMEIELPVRREDFPSNQQQFKIKRITLMASKDDATSEEINVSLKFDPDDGTAGLDGGTVKTQQGLISKLNGNADNWDLFADKTPFGNWTLKLRDENDTASYSAVQGLLNGEKIKDILLVVTYTGKTAGWND